MHASNIGQAHPSCLSLWPPTTGQTQVPKRPDNLSTDQFEYLLEQHKAARQALLSGQTKTRELVWGYPVHPIPAQAQYQHDTTRSSLESLITPCRLVGAPLSSLPTADPKRPSWPIPSKVLLLEPRNGAFSCNSSSSQQDYSPRQGEKEDPGRRIAKSWEAALRFLHDPSRSRARRESSKQKKMNSSKPVPPVFFEETNELLFHSLQPQQQPEEEEPPNHSLTNTSDKTEPLDEHRIPQRMGPETNVTAAKYSNLVAVAPVAAGVSQESGRTWSPPEDGINRALPSAKRSVLGTQMVKVTVVVEREEVASSLPDENEDGEKVGDGEGGEVDVEMGDNDDLGDVGEQAVEVGPDEDSELDDAPLIEEQLDASSDVDDSHLLGDTVYGPVIKKLKRDRELAREELEARVKKMK